MKQSSFMIFLLTLAAGLGFCSAAWGQSPAPVEEKLELIPLGPGPLLNRAPAFAKWTITCAYSDAAQPGSPQEKHFAPALQIVTVTKTNNIYDEQKVYSDGSKEESWHVGSLQIEATSFTNGKLMIYTPNSFGSGGIDPLLYTDYTASDFPNLAWLSPRNYKGVQKNKKGEYMVFKDSIQNPFPGLNSATSDATATIDSLTRLPVQIKTAAVTLNYIFETPPQGLLVLPSDVQRLLYERANTYKTMTKRIPSY